MATIDLTQQELRGFTTSAPISIPAGGATIDSNGFDVLFTGSLTGPGGLTTVGPGSVALLGTNTYLGGTMVSSGTLIVGSPGALAFGSPLSVGSDASLLFANQADRVLPQSVPEPKAIISLLAMALLGLCGIILGRFYKLGF
jgi:hypothetical protein